MVLRKILCNINVVCLNAPKIEFTMRYSRLSDMKAQHDYYKAMERVMQNQFAK